MKLSITPISFNQSLRDGSMTLPSMIRFCSEQNLDGIDLLDPETYAWAWSGCPSIAEALHLLKEQGVAVAAMASGNNFAKSDQQERQQQVALVHRGIERAAEAGAPCLRVFGGYIEATGGEIGMTEAQALPLVIESLLACVDKATEFGVTLALENHGRMPGTAADMLSILQAVNSPALKLAYDPANSQGNSMLEDKDPIMEYHAICDQIAHIHLKDVREPRVDLSRRREPCIAGEGITPLREIIQLLESSDYSGYCTLEFEAGRFVDEITGVTQSLHNLREMAG